MTDDNESSFKSNGVQYILIKSIDLFKNPYKMDTLSIIRVTRVPKRGYMVVNWVHPHITKLIFESQISFIN
jgi:hypothetical protein